MDADVIVVGAGLAGLTATAELARAGRRVLLLDQEPGSNLGGQAFWSFGGLFLVGTPEQRRMGIRDTRELASARTGRAGARAAGSHRGAAQDPGPEGGALIAVRLNILTRKTLGGLQTDLSGRVIGAGAPGGGVRGRGAPAGAGPVRGRRGGRVRRRGDARLPVAGGIVPRRLPVQRPPGRPGRGPRDRRLTGQPNRRCSSSSMASAPACIAASLSSARATISATSLTDASSTLASVPTSSGRSLP